MYALIAIFFASSFFVLWLIEFRLSSSHPSGFYGWQTEAFTSGQLYLKILPRPELANLSNPYDGAQNVLLRVLDLSYYKGHYYSYFGIGPILMLTLPWRLLTHSYLTESGATALFVIASFAIDIVLLAHIRRFFFPNASKAEVICSYLLITLGSFISIHLVGINAGTVAQTGAYFCFDAALACVLWTLTGNSPARGIAATSLFCGLAVACRPSFAPLYLMILPPAFIAYGERKGRHSLIRFTLASVVPCAAIAAGLMYYNFVRFDSIWEFGNRYQMTNVDYRSVTLLSAGNILGHARSFILAPFELNHFFPFFNSLHDQRPIGLLWACPASILSLGLFSLLGRTNWPPSRQAGAFALSVGLAFAGVFLFLAAYLLFLFHYEIDFFVPWVWLVALGWLAAASDSRLPSLLGQIIVRAGAFLCCASVLVAMLYTLCISDSSARLPSVTKAVDNVVSKVDSALGISYGGLALKVRFPATTSPIRLPLVSTGYDHNDLIYAIVRPDSAVQIGYFHAGLGGPLSEPFAIDPGKVHDVEIFMGSLLPPPEDPYFNGWSSKEIFRAKKSLAVTIDGALVLASYADFYDSSPESILTGRNPSLVDVAKASFPGDISVASRLPFPRKPQGRYLATGTGAVAIKLRFAAGRVGATEPLLSTGKSGHGDLVYVTYLQNSKVVFGLHHWGQTYCSQPVPLGTETSHSITIISRSLTNAETGPALFEIIFDSQSVLALNAQTYDSSPDDVYVGINAIGSTVCGGMFSGTVLDVRPVSPPNISLPRLTAQGAIALEMLLDGSVPAAGQPLLVVGRSGMADFIEVVRLDLNHLRFVFDHWGRGGPVGDTIEIDPNLWHSVQIDMGSFRSLGGGHAVRASEYRVLFDKRTVLHGEADLIPATKDNYYIGINPIGGSTCGTAFHGQLRQEELPQ